MKTAKKHTWHEKGPIRMVIWLIIATTTAGAFYTFNNLASKNMAARSSAQASAAASAPAPAPAP